MPKDKLTIKQRKFVKEYIITGNATEAVTRSYNVSNREIAKVIGHENLTKPHLQQAIAVLMQENGIDDQTLFRCLLDGLDSKMITQYKGKTAITDLPDFGVRHKFLETALKIKGIR